MVSSNSRTVMLRCRTKRKRSEKMFLPEIYAESYDDDKPGQNWFEEPSADVEIDGECYDTVIVEGWQRDTVIVEGWQPEMYQDSPDIIIDHTNWTEDGELLAEICVEPSAVEDTREEESILRRGDLQTISDDCTNLSWLMNFKVDDIILKQPDSNKKQDRKSNCESEAADSNVSPHSKVKPPYTYTKLIELALEDKGELTVSGIYKWISDRFPFFKPYDDRWKNSVRHNLSINPHFRKGAKSPRGSGHLWTVAESYSEFQHSLNPQKKIKVEPTHEQEVIAAAASILQQHPSEFLNPVSVEQVASECGLLDDSLSFTF